ncbi:MAG: beta-ketoacyl-ACP synthase 3 [Myxococcales bacterium]|nr:beta-ketoacyl-ACP synthase 3 [Myxococcota bacterium]MDW8280348.1 beta-ketoacyl-ACP synthase 3 [Myxococcales bacterium]
MKTQQTNRKLLPVRIAGSGSFVPPQRLTNPMLVEILNVAVTDEAKRLTSEGIVQVTGIHERRITPPGFPVAGGRLTLRLARERLRAEGADPPCSFEGVMRLIERSLAIVGAGPEWFPLVARSELVRSEVERALSLTQLAQDENDLLLQAAQAGITAAASDPEGVPRMLTSDLAVEAARRCLDRAHVRVEELDAILVARATPDYFAPSVAALVQRKLGAPEIFAADTVNGCSGWVYAMDQAWALVESGRYSNVLVIGVEHMSTVIDYERKDESVIFGDGAGAVLLRPAREHEGQILASTLGARGDEVVMQYKGGGTKFPASELAHRKGWNKFRMQGRKVFAFAVEKFAGLIKEVCSKAGVEVQDVALVVPHQVNLRILQFAAAQLSFPMERVMITLDQFGNMTAASIPFALDTAIEQGRIRPGDLVLFVAFGVGLAWGAMLLRW